MSKQKFYAVHNGRQGTKIYTTWEEVRSSMDIDGPTAVATQPPPLEEVQMKEVDESMEIEALEATAAAAAAAAPPPPEIQLSSDQQRVLDMVKRGESVFFTGSAGTGKSVLLREIIKLRGGRPSNRLGVTASTGIASVNIGGCTLHSWAGIGLGKEDKDGLVGKILGISMKAKNKVLDRWRECQTLIIDETDTHVLFLQEYVARQLRKKERPFGGIQVRGPDRRILFSCHLLSSVDVPDAAFVDMLNSMRFGRMDAQTVMEFRKLSREVHYDDGIEPTELYPTRAEVESANSSRLRKLPGNNRVYDARDLPGRDDQGKEFPPDRVERALKDLVVPKKLPLKNIIQGLLVNGSVGRVIALPDNRERNGQTGPELPGGPAAGKDGGRLEKGPPDAREEKIKQILRMNTIWPAVHFQCGVTQLCVPLTFEVVSAEGTIEATRDQVPLILAWALSIHKSQGQTLERVRVDLSRIFEKGQGKRTWSPALWNARS
ncbi:hypothetical protein OH77DRAFT_1395896 [Trametes cingulata]|nr:hypothetical protein OH77DRAFT_1395896 [Trametes cingulata]